MASLGITAFALLLFVLLATHLSYLRKRTLFAQDRQQALRIGSSFHVCVFFSVRSGQKTIDSARNFTHQILSGGDARLIYAGQVAFSIDSDQLGPARWDGVLLFELASRDRFNAAYSERFRRGRTLFESSYLTGMQRGRLVSFLVPYSQLKLRLQQLVRGKFRAEPLHQLPELQALPRYDAVRGYVRRLSAVQAINGQSLVVYNLAKRRRDPVHSDGVTDTQGLMALLARDSLGPLHLGRFARIEHNAVFDNLYVVQYPSAQYFAQLLQSQFYPTIAENAELADALIVATVPITNRL